VILAIVSLMAVIASSLSPILAADTLKLSLYYKRTFTDVAILTGWHLLGVGIGGFVFIPSSRIWGKRHAYLLGTVIIIISSAWGGASGHNFKSAIASRMFQGIGLAPYEALVNASVGDLYFVHERGVRMAITNWVAMVLLFRRHFRRSYASLHILLRAGDRLSQSSRAQHRHCHHPRQPSAA
jgi:MFS family permease